MKAVKKFRPNRRNKEFLDSNFTNQLVHTPMVKWAEHLTILSASLDNLLKLYVVFLINYKIEVTSCHNKQQFFFLKANNLEDRQHHMETNCKSHIETKFVLKFVKQLYTVSHIHCVNLIYQCKKG